MSKRANPASIGAFVLGAAAIAVGLLAYFGSNRLLGGDKISFVCFFEDAVDGLQIGSKVNLKGVPIGEVTKILIRFNDPSNPEERTKPLIPVIIEVDRERLSEDLGVELDLDDEEDYRRQIREGLSATLGMGNLITGILQVSLDYEENDVENEELSQRTLKPFVYEGEVYRVIPTEPSQLQRATQDLLSVVANISETDFKGLVEGLKEMLEKIGGKFDQFEVKGINEAIASIQTRMESEKFDDALDTFTEAVSEIKTLAAKLDDQLGDDEVREALVSANQSMNSIDETFRSMQETVQGLNEILANNQDVPAELERSIKEIGDAAAQVTLFVQELREKPNALIFGRRDRDEGSPAERERRPWRAGPGAR